MNGAKSEDSGGAGSDVVKAKSHLKEHPFDQNELSDAWNIFAGTVDAAQLKSALSVREPILHENSCIVYNLDNEVQRQRITLDLKPKLLAYLHKVLKNDRISIEFNVTESQEEILNKPYTEQEKFNTLAAKYPALGILKQRFGLDFE